MTLAPTLGDPGLVDEGPPCGGYDVVISQQRGAAPTLTVRCTDCGWQQPAAGFELDDPAGSAVLTGVIAWLEHS